MNPDLVGPAGPGPCLDQGSLPESLAHLDLGRRALPGGRADPYPGPPPLQRSVHQETFLLDPPSDKGQISAVHLVSTEHLGQGRVRGVVLGHHHETRRARIQPMDDPGTIPSAPAGQLDLQGKEPVHQRARPPGHGRVGGHPGRLRDHQQVVILIGDGQRARLGGHLAGLWDQGLDAFASGQAVRFLAAPAVDQDQALGDRPLYVSPRYSELPRDHGIEPTGVCGERGRIHLSCRSQSLSAAGCRRSPARRMTRAPTTMAESARLNTGQTWKSMKSMTSPDTPGPRMIRSVRLPRAPPRISPRPSALAPEESRPDATTIAAHTTRVAAKKSQGCPPNRPKAPPEFVVYRSWATSGMTWTGGLPARYRSARCLVRRSRR